MNAIEAIRQLIAERSVATVQDVCAAISANARFVGDVDSLQALAKIERFSDIHLVDEFGSVHFGHFRPDWSCDSWGYGYKTIVTDIRQKIVGKCDHPDVKLYLATRVHH